MIKSLPLATLLLALSPLLAHADERPWSEIARTDLQFAADAIEARHPGAVLGHPNVRLALERGLRHGLADAPLVKNQDDYRALMRRFIYGFGDPHTGLSVGSKLRAWSGLLLDQVNGRFEVVHAEPGLGLPALGSEVVACDGVWLGTYLKAKVAPAVVDGMELSVTPSKLARRVMFVNEIGWQPSQCQFRLADGTLITQALSYPRVPEDIAEARLDAALAKLSAPALPVGITAPAPGVLWFGMPSFNMGDAALVAAYNKAYAELKQRKGQARFVVFDLRGNGGGASSLGAQAIEALYGKPYVQTLEKLAYSSKKMVASKEAQAQFGQYLQTPGVPDHVRAQIADAHAKLGEALEKGQRVFDLETPLDEATLQSLRRTARQHPAGPRMVALIDRGCFSSCMGFLQMLSAAQDTLVLGEATLGYSPYGEITPVPLPSGHGSLSLPSAFFGSDQAPQQPFVPAIAYPGRMAETAAVQAWVMQQLKLKTR